MKSRLLVVSAFLFCVNIAGINVSAEHWVKKGPDGSVQQRVILLGDRHTYYSEYPQEAHGTLTAIKDQEQKDVIELAKKLKATILVEDYYSSWWQLPRTVIFKLLFNDVQANIASYLWGLGNVAKESAVSCLNIEARNPVLTSSVVGGFHALVLTFALRVAQEAMMQRQASAHDIFVTHYKKWLAYVGTAAVTAGLPMLMVWLEQKQMQQRMVSLSCAMAFGHYITMVKNGYSEDKNLLNTSNYTWMVDVRALLTILENSSHNYIVCAGYAHTSNIATFLALQGYTMIKSLEGLYLDCAEHETVSLRDVLVIADIITE